MHYSILIYIYIFIYIFLQRICVTSTGLSEERHWGWARGSGGRLQLPAPCVKERGGDLTLCSSRAAALGDTLSDRHNTDIPRTLKTHRRGSLVGNSSDKWHALQDRFASSVSQDAFFLSSFSFSVCVFVVVVWESLVARHESVIVKMTHFRRDLPNPWPPVLERLHAYVNFWLEKRKLKVKDGTDVWACQ